MVGSGTGELGVRIAGVRGGVASCSVRVRSLCAPVSWQATDAGGGTGPGPSRAGRGGAAGCSAPRAPRARRLYWSASLVSYAGSALTNVALPILVFGLTGSTFLTGLVVALEALAYVLFGLYAGVLAN